MIDADMVAQVNNIFRAMRDYNRALDDQRDLAIRAAAQTLPEDVAAQAPLLYPAWDWQSCKRDMIVNYNGQLYRVLNTPTDNRPPDAEGMLAVYRPIVPAHAGTTADPIPWVYGMDCKAGLYYSYADQLWLCKSDMAPCVWAPGSDPAMWSTT